MPGESGHLEEKQSSSLNQMPVYKEAIPIQAWTGPEGSRRLRLPEFLDSRHMEVANLSALHTGRLYPMRFPLYSDTSANEDNSFRNHIR